MDKKQKIAQRMVAERAETIEEILILDNVPCDYQTACALISIGVSLMDVHTGRRHTVSAMRAWADNIEKGKMYDPKQ